MNTFADYEAWKAKRQAAGVGAASVVIGAQDQSPDQLAGDLNLANEFGKVTGNPVPPVPMVGEYRSVFQSAIEKKRAETILSSSPRLTEWLRNPENAGVARDDLEGLSWWETGLGATWNATKRGAMRAGPQAANQYLANSGERIAADQNRSFGEILQDARDPIMVDGNEVGRAWVGPSALAGAAYRWLNSRTVPTTAEGTISGAAVFQQRAGSVAKRIEQIPMSPGGEAGKLRFMEAAKAEGWQAQLQALGSAFVEAPGEMTSFLLQTAAESLPSMAAAAGVGVATRNPGAAAAVMGGTSFVAEYGSAPVEFFKEKGIDVSTPEGAMSAIRNPELMREAEQRGITRGVIIGALDGLSGGIAGAKLAESALGNMVLQSITQAVLGAGGEAGAQVASGQEFNIAEVVLEGLAEFVTAPVEVGSMAVSNLRDMQVRARDAEARVGLFQELSGQAVNSKLRGRMPDRFRQFVEQATENGPVENVFVPAQDFVEYFQSVGVDPFDLVNELDGVTRDDLDAALAGGGDLRIPTATYAAKIAGSEHDAFLMENMRFDPMEMTAREAAEFNARVDDVMQEMWADAEDARAEDEKWRAVEAKIYDEMVSRFRIAGRSTDVATTEAMIYPAFYRVMAERSGLSTEEFLERYPLPQVQGAIPQGLQQKNVDDLTRTLATLRARTKKTETTTPLLEWIDKRGGIDDIGGELAARNAAEIKRGRGKKTLRLARKLTEDRKPILSDVERKGGARFGWDDVAAAAVEQGFMADNPVVLEWKDAMLKGDRVAPDLVPALMDEIDRELAGQGGEVDPQEADFDAMEEYLSRLGVSLDDSDDAIRAAIETAASDDARMYGQDGQIATESDAFKAWFGDSKVVDADGKPLVVYHGTNASDFAAFKPGSWFSESRSESSAYTFASDIGKRNKAAGKYRVGAGAEFDGQAFEYFGTMSDIDSPEAGQVYATDQGVVRYLGAGKWEVFSDLVVDYESFDGDVIEVRAGDASAAAQGLIDEYEQTVARSFPGGDGGRVYPVYLSIKNPIKLDAMQANRIANRLGMGDAEIEALIADFEAQGYDGIETESDEATMFAEVRAAEGGIPRQWIAFRPTQIKSVFNRGTWDANDPRILYQGGAHPFAGFTREQFLGNPKITSDSNASTLKPRAFQSLDNVEAVPFAAGRGLVAKYDDASAAVFDGDKVIASYNFGDTLVVDKKYRRQGIGEELVYQWRMRNPDAKTATHRTKASQALQEKVWDRVQREISADRSYNQSASAGSTLDGLLASVRENMARKASLSADLAAAGRPVMFSTADGRRAMAGPDMSKPGGFRLTYLGADGQPSEHSEFATLAEAIRRALDEGMEPSVAYQQAQDQDQPLYVVHNLSAEKLRHAADLGGLAAPSIAVARGDIGFNSFGEISLIGDPSMADPKKKGVRLFNADVYSPRQPRARYKVDKKAAAALNATLRPVAERLGLPFDDIGAYDIERDGLSAVNGQMVAKAAWLESIGETVPVVREEPEEPAPVNGMGMIKGTDPDALVTDPAFLARVQRKYELALSRYDGNADMIAKINAAWLDEAGNISAKMIRNWADQVAKANRAIEDFRAGTQPEGQVSRYLTGKAIDDAVGGRIGDFNGWVREKFGGLITDMFFETEAGRKKEYTLSNLVREMTRTIRNGENWNYGAGNVRAAVAPEFKALAEVKAARGQITDEKGMEALKTEVNNKLFALADKFAPFAGSEGKGFGWGDNFSEFLRDVARGPRAVAEWPWSSQVPDELMSEAVGFLEKLKGLPTNYFEIKMQRAVDLSEFTAALVPSDLAADARKILTDAGLELVEYQGGIDGAGRQDALSRIGERVFFQGPRGQISIMADGSSVISLFETANLSTVLHESGHYFLTVMQDLAAKGEANAAAEYEAVKGWWRGNAAAVAADANRAMPDVKLTVEDVQRAIDTGSTGDVMKDAAVDVGMQEQWARAFEAYLMEGNAPSIELRSAFEKFRAWLISVYKRLTGLNVKMSDDIRQVFDRMLASDAEIEKAKRSSGDTGSVFASAEQMGLTPQEYDRFLKLRAQAEDDAKARLMSEVMEPIKREADKAYRAEKEKVRAEVERNINASPVYRAWEWMGNRRWLGEGQPPNLPDMRMSKDVLVERYGAGVLKTLPRGMQTIYSVDGGLDPDDAAGWFGFDSGDQMIRALERAPGRKDAIKAETDRVMNERHNDPLTDGEIERRALDAVHNDKRGQWIAAELEAVRKVIGSGVGLTAKEARASARQTIARMTVRDATAAQRFLAAERKAAEEAYQLAGKLSQQDYWENRAKFMKADPQGRPVQTAEQADMIARLYAAKRRQLMNHALYMEARAVAEEVEKAERFIQKLTKASTREKIAGAGRRENAQTDYLAAIDEVMDRYDFRRLSGRAEDRRGALLAYVEAMKAQGRENQLAIPEKVLQDAGRKPYKTLSVEELRGVIDTLKNVEHTALRWNDLIDAINKRKLDDAVAEVTAAFDQNMPKRPPGRVATTGEAVRNSVRQFLDLVLNAGTILREIDGFKDMGAAYRNLKAPIDEAMDRLTVRKEKAATDLEALYAVYPKEERRRMAVREHIPALGYALSKWERIAVALNTGNEGNMQRLTDERVRGSLTPDQVAEVLKTLDERDADFIQSVWDYVGSFRDDIAARERRTTGVEPAWVDAKPVVIGGKTLRGGYYPLKYDPRLSTLARDDEAQAIGEALQAGRFGKAQTKRGHLEARAKSSGRDVELDMSVLHRHVNQVIYDLELSEPVANSWKVLQSGGVRQAFMDAGRQADFDALETWLKDVAEGQISAGDWVNRNARRFKSNFTAAKLAFNLGTVMAQVTGLSQTMVVVGKRDFLRGLQASFRPGIADEIAAKSAFMRQRQTTFNKDISDFYSDPQLGPYASRWGDIRREWIGPASFWLMTKVQWITVDIPTWMAGYQQGLRQYGGDEAKAIAHADAIVKRAQASGLFSDRSAIERGSLSRTTRQNDVVRLFTTLGSYMFAKFNVAYERTMVAGRAIRDEGVSLKAAQEAASWALDVAFLFALEAVVMAAIKGKLPDDEDDEDEGWAKFLAKETAMSILGTIPFVRDVASVGSGFEGGGAYGGITAEVAKPFQEIGQGEIDKGFVKSVISGTGLFLGLPATQINRAVDAGWRAAEGEDVSPLEYLLGKRGK